MAIDILFATIQTTVIQTNAFFSQAHGNQMTEPEMGTGSKTKEYLSPNRSHHHRLIKYSLDILRPIRTAKAFEAVDWLHQQTWLDCGIA